MEAARSECEGDGASDVEAFFASQEEAKPPNILAKKRMEATKVYKKRESQLLSKREKRLIKI
ncbi:hypothetical protein ACQGS7_07095 [Bacillus sp. GFa4/2]|uniref:hypothetical protein n=1 Tax=Bacillus sp. GFa4/2 TaxID=3418495 RepID=UPI003CE73C40